MDEERSGTPHRPGARIGGWPALVLVALTCATLAGCKGLRPDPIFYRAYPGDHRPDAEIARLVPVGEGQRITHLDGVVLPKAVAQGGHGLEVMPGPLSITVEFSYGQPFTYCPPNTTCYYGKGNPLQTSFVAEPGRTYHVGREFPDKDVWAVKVTDGATGAVVPIAAVVVQMKPAAPPAPPLDPLAQRRHDIALLEAGDALDASRAAERLGAAGPAAVEALPALERFFLRNQAVWFFVNWTPTIELAHGTLVQSPLPAARAIARIGGCERVLALLPHATDATRWMVYQGFGHATERCASKQLIAALDSGSTDEWRAAAWSLGKLKDPEAVGPLLEAMAEHDGFFSVPRRVAYIEALGEIGDARAVEALIAQTDETLLGIEASGITVPAANALKKITGMDFGTDSAGWRRWWSAMGRTKHLGTGK